MDWVVQKKTDGEWEDVAYLTTRKQARTAVQGTKYLFPGGDKYRIRKNVALALVAESKPKVAEKELKDLWGYLPIRFQEEIRDHDRGCALDCGVKWLRDHLLQAGVDINR